jgi:hypothetical protein
MDGRSAGIADTHIIAQHGPGEFFPSWLCLAYEPTASVA